MTAYAQLKVDGSVVSNYADYEVAAFCGEECRGVAKVQALEDDNPILYLRIRSNVTNGETITFRVYQVSTQEEIRLEETVEFEPQTMAGTPGKPLMLTFGDDVLNGDVNGDNVVDALDASLILQYVAHKFGDDNTDFIIKAADTNNSNEVDALDASLVLQHAAKKIDLNEIEKAE
jgi:hypothetical protein